MKNKPSVVLLALGILFLFYAILGRYLVLPGYLAGLDRGSGTLEGASEVASTWEIIRYLLWAYAFKLGIFLIILGTLLRTAMSSTRRWAFGIGGFIYIGFAYMPLPAPGSIVFGVAGGLITLLMLYIIWRWAEQRQGLQGHLRSASDFRMAGTFFFAMATYTLCPLLGVKTFALSPEKMIRYGLQAEAASFALHLLIELTLGWLFLTLSSRQAGLGMRENRKETSAFLQTRPRLS